MSKIKMTTDLEIALKNFKQEIISNYISKSDNRFIYLRLSKLDNSLSKDEQIPDAINKLKADFTKLLELYPELNEGFNLFVEIKSAYTDSAREEFIYLCENHLFKEFSISEILRPNLPKQANEVYISAYDRISRKFLYSLPIQIIRLFRNIKFNTLIPEEIELEKKGKNILEKSNQDQLMWVFQQMMFSSMASKHSEDMSNKIKKRRTKDKHGVTISSKTGKKWGAPQRISNSMKKRIKERINNFSAKEISEQSDIYQIIEGKRKPISIHSIIKIVKE